MCGISAIVDPLGTPRRLHQMLAAQRHRGPDAEGHHWDPDGNTGLGHNRLSIIDLSDAGRQPMFDRRSGRWIVFNGEIYNYLELRRDLDDYPYQTNTDTEVILAAFDRWGPACLDRLFGMFAFAIWDEREQRLFAARDRFGVKPLYFHQAPDGALLLASEIKALHAAGVKPEPDPATWATYLATGFSDHSQRTFWKEIQAVPPGHTLSWDGSRTSIRRWYDLAERSGSEFDQRSEREVREEYLELLRDSVRLRFRSDVPVGLNLSGGLDSSLLLGLVDDLFGKDNQIQVFTYATGDSRYDELPWVQAMLANSRHPLHVSWLKVEDVPELASRIQDQEDEPFGGFPTLAYSKIFDLARSQGVIVLLEGQGIDEQWAGYDYYQRVISDRPPAEASTVQGTTQRATRPECLTPEFARLVEPPTACTPFHDPLRNLQYRDICSSKIPKAVRFNDRISMRVGTELREPFLDHRLMELALRQPADRKIRDGVTKWTVRQLARELLPANIVNAPKRPLQTPQREWLQGPLRDWAAEHIRRAADCFNQGWLRRPAVIEHWDAYVRGESDNSFFVWQWISLALSLDLAEQRSARLQHQTV